MPDPFNETQTSGTFEAQSFLRSSQKSFLIYNKRTNLSKLAFLFAMERETNTPACRSETISTFKFALDYNTWAANSAEENSDTAD